MAERRATFQVLVGPNEGDTLNVERGYCRLIGRHLSEHETVLMDPEGNRELDASANELLQKRFEPAAVAGTKEAAGKEKRRGGRASAGAAPYTRGPDIILSDGAISRAHAMIFADESGPGIIDLASTNGTYVNNKRVTSSMLEDGDVVVLGSSELTVQSRKK
jgi:pSer/pThr/pTyr-binding forkhead associated (FHA) protein